MSVYESVHVCAFERRRVAARVTIKKRVDSKAEAAAGPQK